jgi:hypothetical protein
LSSPGRADGRPAATRRLNNVNIHVEQRYTNYSIDSFRHSTAVNSILTLASWSDGNGVYLNETFFQASLNKKSDCGRFDSMIRSDSWSHPSPACVRTLLQMSRVKPKQDQLEDHRELPLWGPLVESVSTHQLLPLVSYFSLHIITSLLINCPKIYSLISICRPCQRLALLCLVRRLLGRVEILACTKVAT